MKSPRPVVPFEAGWGRGIIRASSLIIVGTLGGSAWAQLGSFNQPPERLPQVALAGIAPEPTLPTATQFDLPLPTLNNSSIWPATFTRLFPSVSLSIPDNSAVGVTHQQVVSGVPGTIAALQVQLTVSSRDAGPMFNGDLVATLSHDSGYVVLLNRVGRRPDSAVGYGDNGFNLTLTDTAAADVHTYRVSLGGSDFVPISSADPAVPLGGSWQPDGRVAAPESVVTGSPRITSLAAFNGLNPNGTWTLFFADMGAGGLAQMESWNLEFTVVPEPEVTASVSGAALFALALARRRWATVK